MRRIARFGLSMILFAGLLGLGGPARATEASASDAVQSFYAVLLDCMKNAGSLGVKGRYKKLEPVILGSFDVPYMTKVAVGPLWNQLQPEQKQQAWTAFGRFVTATYAHQFDGYSGEQLKIEGEQKIKHATLVRTNLVKSSGEATALNYVVHQNEIGWQIRDIYLTSTISQIATRRSEFAAILKDGGIDALIAMLNKKSEDLES